MAREVVSLLEPSRGGLFVDCTAGLGGHTAALLDAGASVVGVELPSGYGEVDALLRQHAAWPPR